MLASGSDPYVTEAAWKVGRLYGKRLRQTDGRTRHIARSRSRRFIELLENKYFIDEIYDATVIRFNAWAAWFMRFPRPLDLGQMVLLAAWNNPWTGRGCTEFTDEFVVNLGFDAGCETLREGGGEMSKWQNGRVQTYLRVIGVALVVLVLFLIWGRRS